MAHNIFSDDDLDEDAVDEDNEEFLSGRDSVIFGISCCKGKMCFLPFGKAIIMHKCLMLGVSTAFLSCFLLDHH